MTKQQHSILDRRFREALEQQPDLEVLRGLLLGLGGTDMVAPPIQDVDMSSLIDAGFVMAGPVVRRAMKKSECHRNIAEIWAEKRHGLVGIGTGYSLADDGLWRQHSWGVLREGILETTELRVKYFGVLLQHGDADSFAMANLGSGRMSHGKWNERHKEADKWMHWLRRKTHTREACAISVTGFLPGSAGAISRWAGRRCGWDRWRFAPV